MANKFIIIIALSLITYGIYNLTGNISGGCPFHSKNDQQQENLRHSQIKTETSIQQDLETNKLKHRITFKSEKCNITNEVEINGKCKQNDIDDLPSTTIINDDFTLQWGFDSNDDSIIYFKQSVNLRTWMGLGFNNQMKGADMIITQIEEEEVTIYEGIALGHEPPKPNPDQSDIELLGGEFTSDSIVVKFSRQLSPNITGYAKLQENDVYTWIAAHSPADKTSDLIDYHGSANHFDFNLKLNDDFTPSSPICDEDTVFINQKCQKNDIERLSSNTEISDGFFLQWSVDEKNNKAYFMIELDFQSWVGFGFGKQMKGADVFVGQILPHGVVTVYESIAPEHAQPKPNKQQFDIELLGYSISDNNTVIKFSRDMTTDVKKVLQLKEGELYDMIAAHSDPKEPVDQITYHGDFHYNFEIILSNDQES